LATPAVNDLHNTSITEFANQHTADVIRILKDVVHYPSLHNIDTALTFASGYASLPSDYLLATAVKVTTTSPAVTKKRCRLFFKHQDFARMDSSNFILTPNQERPVALVADKIYIKPTTLTAGFLDYIEKHPTISGSQGTVFDVMGDNILVNLILASYYGFIEEEGLQEKHLKLAGAI
jgi:hypothetical protein